MSFVRNAVFTGWCVLFCTFLSFNARAQTGDSYVVALDSAQDSLWIVDVAHKLSLKKNSTLPESQYFRAFLSSPVNVELDPKRSAAYVAQHDVSFVKIGSSTYEKAPMISIHDLDSSAQSEPIALPFNGRILDMEITSQLLLVSLFDQGNFLQSNQMAHRLYIIDLNNLYNYLPGNEPYVSHPFVQFPVTTMGSTSLEISVSPDEQYAHISVPENNKIYVVSLTSKTLVGSYDATKTTSQGVSYAGGGTNSNSVFSSVHELESIGLEALWLPETVANSSNYYMRTGYYNSPASSWVLEYQYATTYWHDHMKLDSFMGPNALGLGGKELVFMDLPVPLACSGSGICVQSTHGSPTPPCVPAQVTPSPGGHTYTGIQFEQAQTSSWAGVGAFVVDLSQNEVVLANRGWGTCRFETRKSLARSLNLNSTSTVRAILSASYDPWSGSNLPYFYVISSMEEGKLAFVEPRYDAQTGKGLNVRKVFKFPKTYRESDGPKIVDIEASWVIEEKRDFFNKLEKPN